MKIEARASRPRRIRLAACWARAAVVHPLLDFVLPTDCFCCSRPLDAGQRLGACSTCWVAWTPVPRPACPACGMPAAAATDLLGPARGMCARCRNRRRDLDHVRAVVVYDAHARAFVLRAKLGGRPELLRALADLVAADLRAAGLPAPDTVLAPVPSHPLADLRRGFSPAGEIARALARIVGRDVRSRLLARRFLPLAPQKRLGRGRRKASARAGFRVRSGADVPDKVLLIDDVLTTGATLEACAGALKLAGSTDVRAVVWARALD